MSHPDRLDAIIDDVARGMTRARGIDMRSAVMARLGTQRRPRPWLLPASALAAVACTALILAALGTRHSARQESVIGNRQSAIAHRQSAIVREQAELIPAKSRLTAPNAEPRVPRPEPRVPSADQLAWQRDAVANLEAPALLTLEDIQPEQLAIRPLTMTPLDVPLIGAEEDE